ncbi:Na(+)/H(+) antiporter subunit C [Canibacter zhoujuaniae]|uniref:Na(+)/H(+) antiporter subunit C n=1 Tax=Canibacter zhoujuaniae TaxID=2708343 RepID=UPI001421ED82|nr:Na(+)/H(+) antiporter subunit C [Canibacter zhoujuaniae]
MTVSLLLVVAMVVMYAVGFTLMLDRGFTRILLGFLLVGNATNLLIFMMSGSFGAAPLVGTAEAEEMNDPLPQAFVLTAIVITFAVSAFLLALIYRAFRHAEDHDDRVSDDAEDVEITQSEQHGFVEEISPEELEQVVEFDIDDDGEDDRLSAAAKKQTKTEGE